jgi:hypothetical protein
MKFRPWPILLALAFVPISLRAAADTSHQRAVYNEINGSVDSLTKVTGSCRSDDTDVALAGWMEGRQVRKIVAISGGSTTEYYLENGRLLFVLATVEKSGGKGGQASERVTERMYFENGAIVKWLSDDKSAGVLHGEDYASQAEALDKNATAYAKVLQSKGKAGTVTEGVFLGIEEGDYFHWKIRTADGERSFFVLHPDATVEKVVQKPKEFIGRRCRVTWKKSKETVPESGGTMEVEQILSVEWL